jgi:hypothetical protein
MPEKALAEMRDRNVLAPGCRSSWHADGGSQAVDRVHYGAPARGVVGLFYLLPPVASLPARRACRAGTGPGNVGGWMMLRWIN